MIPYYSIDAYKAKLAQPGLAGGDPRSGHGAHDRTQDQTRDNLSKEIQSQMVSKRAWQEEQVGVPPGEAWNRASAEVSEQLGEAERIRPDEAAGRAKPEVDRDTGLRAVWTEVRIDPVSGREVANSDARLSAMRSGVRVYFESEDNWRPFEARYGAEEQSKCTAENSSSQVR